MGKGTKTPKQTDAQNVLIGKLGPDGAQALDDRIREVTAGDRAELAKLAKKVTKMMAEQRRHNELLRQIPVGTPGREEAVAEADQVSEQLNNAKAAVNDVIDDAQQGSVDDDAVEEAEEQVEQAAEAAESLEGRLSALTETVQGHHSILVRDFEGERPSSRLDTIEESIVGLGASVEGLHSRVSAQSRGGSKAGLWAGLGTFVAVTLVAWMIYLAFTDTARDIEWAVVWGLGLGGLVGILVSLFEDEGMGTAFAAAYASARRGRNQPVQHGDEGNPYVVDEHELVAGAEADAQGGHSHAAADAHVGAR